MRNLQKRFGKKGWDDRGGTSIFVLFAVLLAVIAVALFLVFFGSFSDFYHAKFSKPEEHLVYAEKKAFLAKNTGLYDLIYRNTENQMDPSGIALEESITLQVGEGGAKFVNMAKAIGLELSWVQSVGTQYLINSKDGNLDLKSTFLVNGQTLISPELMLMKTDGNGYFGVPELTDTYLKLSIGDGLNEEKYQEMLGKYAKMQEVRPDRKEGRELLSKYLGLVFDQVKNVEKTKNVVLESDEVTQKCTQLKMVLSVEELRKIMKSICKELAKDEEVKEILKKYCEAKELEFEKELEVFQSDLENLEYKADLDYDFFGITQLTVQLYLDDWCNVIGRVYEFDLGMENKAIFKVIAPRKKDKIGLEATAQVADKKVSLAGTGSIKGNKLDGQYVFKLDGKKLLKLQVENLRLNGLEKSHIEGHFTVTCAEGVAPMDLLEGLKSERDLYGALSVALTLIKPGLDFVVDAEPKRHSVELGLLDGEKDAFRILIQGGLRKAVKVKVPDKAVDVEDMEAATAYFESWNWNKVEKAMEKANMPEEYRKTIVKYSDTFSVLPKYIQKSKKAKDDQVFDVWRRAAMLSYEETKYLMSANETYLITITQDAVTVKAMKDPAGAGGQEALKEKFCALSDLTDGYDFAGKMSTAAGKDIDHVTIMIDHGDGSGTIVVTTKHPDKYSYDDVRGW